MKFGAAFRRLVRVWLAQGATKWAGPEKCSTPKIEWFLIILTIQNCRFVAPILDTLIFNDIYGVPTAQD